MGTLKLNKKATNSETQQVKAVEKLAEKKLVNALSENLVTNEAVEDFELCALAKQDDGFVEEFKSLRTENETVYRRNDRTCRKVITTAPTRYLAADGEYKEIGNRLIDSGTEIINEENSFKVKFNKDKHTGKIFDLQKGKKTITLSAASSEKSRSHSCGCKCELCTGKDNVVTATLDDGTEIQYITLNDRIKENIIIKNRQDSYEYKFTLNIGDLAVEEGENNDLLLKDNTTGETEFIILAPYMYDANKKHSDKVSYDIDVIGEELLINVIADKDFINATDRAFPVTIDPNIVLSGSNSGIKYGCKVQTFDENETIENYPGVLEVYESQSGERCEAYVEYTTPTHIEEGTIVSVKLALTCCEGYGVINITGAGSIEPTDEENIDVYIDVTNTSSGYIKLTPSSRVYSNALFITTGDLAPRFVIEYIKYGVDPIPDPDPVPNPDPNPPADEETGIKVPSTNKDNTVSFSEGPNYKELELGEKAKGYLNLNDGTLITTIKSLNIADFTLPINITHIHKLGTGNSQYGENWQLNLNKKLKKAPDDTIKTTRFIYTDEIGDKYTFEEKYYYLSDGKKIFLDKNNITANINGELYYGTNPVYTYQSCRGYTLISEINDFKNSELIEQRQEKQAQLEEYVKQYEPSLKSYVKAYANSGIICSRIYSLTKSSYDAFVSGITSSSGYLIITENEALQLQSIYANISQVDMQLTQLDMQQRQIAFQKNQIEHQKTQIIYQKTDLSNTQSLSKALYPNEYNNIINFNVSGDDNERTKKSNKIREQMSYQSASRSITALNTSSNDLIEQKNSLVEQETSITKQKTALGTQKTQLTAQRDLIIKQARANLEIVKKTFLDYFAKQAELDLIVLQAPVNYIRDNDGIINGFNKNGDLVLIGDSYGNSVGISYNQNKQLSEIYEENGTAVRFEYVGNKLVSITDNRGRAVKYEYSGDKLLGIVYPDGIKYAIKYSSSRIASITSDNGTQWKMSYLKDSGMFEHLTVKRIKPVSATVSEVAVDYYGDSSVLEYSDGTCERYNFDKAKNIISYNEKDCANFDTNTEFVYEKNTIGKLITKIKRIDPDWKSPIVETNQYNEIDLLISKIADWQNVSDTVKVKTETKYEYDTANNLLSEISTKFIDESGTISEIKSITKYGYNAQGSLVLTESYVEGEELTSGKNYKQNVYDKNGHIIKSISWNSLDSSSKFYEESTRAENGQVVSDRDETGNIYAEYDYVANSNTVNSVKFANGSTFAYGRNPNNDVVTSITQSTENGEANTTDIIYEYGLPVKVKSGNTIIDYTYDGKDRKKSVTINGVLQSEYSYEDFKQDGPDDRRFAKNSCSLIVDGKAIKSVYLKEGNLDSDIYQYDTRESLTVGKDRLYLKNYDYDGVLTDISYKTETENTVSYEYDAYNNLVKATTTSGGVDVSVENYTYNGYGELILKSYSGTITQTYEFTYKNNAAHDIDYITFGDYAFKPLTDVNGRNTGREIYKIDNVIKPETDVETEADASGTEGDTETDAKVEKVFNKVAAEYITYRKVGDHATNMPATVWFGSGANIKDCIKYKYDKSGNICEITENGHIAVKYSYDDLNRVVREDNKNIGKTVLYSYDNNGNITERCEYEYTLKSGEDLADIECEHYSYDYDGDKLIKIISAGGEEEFAYNSIGNPTLYRDKEIEWQYGTQLVNFNGTTFGYDGLGRRIKKDDIEFIYDNDGRLIAQSNGVEFVYDNNGVTGIIYEGEQYFYRKDAQGNIIAILDSNGNVVVRYIYDCWGNHAIVAETGEDVVDGIGIINPFRYRGYYYDDETGLYFLQTRYYDPEISRFISQDNIDNVDLESSNGINLYAYCLNNPIMAIDPDGTMPKWLRWLLGGLIIVAAVALSVVTAGLATPISAALGGGMLGAIVGGAVAGAIGGAITGFGISVATQAISNGFENINWSQVGFATLGGAITGAILGGLGGGIKYAKAASYLKSNGITDVKGTLNNFKGIPSVKTSNGTIGYRYYDGINAFQKGRYLTNALTNNPVKNLVLYNNQATMMSKFVIQNGTKYLVGRIAGSPVNALQYFVANINWLTLL